MQTMGVAHVREALNKLGLGIQVIEFERSTATAQAAADNVGCELGQIVKSLGFMINKTAPVLVLTCGDQTIDERKLAARFAVGRKKVRMMSAEQCLAFLGYAPGGVPPIAHRSSDIPVYLDETLRRFETVYAAGAPPTRSSPCDWRHYKRLPGDHLPMWQELERPISLVI